jgi:hypothetical protein
MRDEPPEDVLDDDEADAPCQRCGHPAEEHDVVDEGSHTVVCGVVVGNHWCPCEGYDDGRLQPA